MTLARCQASEPRGPPPPIAAVETLVDESCDADQPPDFWRMEELARRYQSLVLAPMPLAEDEPVKIGVIGTGGIGIHMVQVAAAVGAK